MIGTKTNTIHVLSCMYKTRAEMRKYFIQLHMSCWKVWGETKVRVGGCIFKTNSTF